MTKRTQRVDSELRKEISSILTGALKNKEPDLKGLVSVTEVDVSPDLKTAKVYVSVFSAEEEERARSFAIICANAGFVRRELARVMRMRTVPELTFKADESFEYGSRMDELLSKLHKDES